MYCSFVLLTMDDRAQNMGRAAAEALLDRTEGRPGCPDTPFCRKTEERREESMEAFAFRICGHAPEGSRGGTERKEEGV